MDYATYCKKLTTLRLYIEKSWANTPKQLSQKLDVSERTILRMVNNLREQNCIVKYCKKDKIYKIEEDN
ncbi:HTH domain-containing protein [Puia dinghuensis]|nr:HTH domain-containing protein [Puia dinghuensis]